jgi:KUP system potassium uptake protein
VVHISCRWDLHIPPLSDQRLDDDSKPLTAEGSNPVLPLSSMSAEEDPALEHELAALREVMASGFTYLLTHGDVRARN